MTEEHNSGAAMPAGRAEDSGDPSTAIGPLDSIKALFAQAKATVDTEIALGRAASAVILSSAKTITLWGVVALLFAFVALLVLAIGSMMLIAQHIGIGGGMAVVLGVLLVVIAVAAWRIRGGARIISVAVAELKSGAETGAAEP
ncbi:MAG: hypothetical protein MUF41_06570 [Sphingopyxis sp.]|nr:hypothetical protein [Sphingopyxis sp.]